MAEPRVDQMVGTKALLKAVEMDPSLADWWVDRKVLNLVATWDVTMAAVMADQMVDNWVAPKAVGKGRNLVEGWVAWKVGKLVVP